MKLTIFTHSNLPYEWKCNEKYSLRNNLEQRKGSVN